MYRIMGVYKELLAEEIVEVLLEGGQSDVHEIDTADTLDEAWELVGEYKMAFGAEWKIYIDGEE